MTASTYQLIHACGTRLRLGLPIGFVGHHQLDQWLINADGVVSHRINKIAQTVIIYIDPGDAESGGLEATYSVESFINSLPSCEDFFAGTSVQASSIQAVKSAPVTAPPPEEDEDKFVPSRIILPLSSLALALLAGPLALPPIAVGGFILVAAHLSFKRAWAGLRDEKKINVDFLDALAVTLHSLEGFLLGPALMISMIEGGEAVRDATQRIAHSANTDLLASLQSNVRKLVDGEELLVPSESLLSGDRVVFFPGDSIPIDGVIVDGEGSFDVVKLTGESVPRFGQAGDEILAGFILLEGTVVAEVRATGEDTRIGQITSLIENAPVFDTRVGNYAAKIANRFVIPTLVLAGVSLLISSGNIAQAASLLMFDLGTGLRVSVPTAIMAALSRASSQGLLIRSGRSLEILADVDVVVFDKTGTLTQGHPSVVHVQTVSDEWSLSELLSFAATAEQGLKHPIAQAVVDYASHHEVQTSECENWDYVIGKGVSCTIHGRRVLVGNRKLLIDEAVPNVELDHDDRLSSATPVYLAIDGAVAAVFFAADQLRSDSRQLIAELHRRGIQAHMLTGDISSVAHAVAADLGLQEHEVHAEALPDQKAQLVQQLSEQGHTVAFVGDGINDSAALAYADVSISFASGSDLARETADIVLTNDKVSGLIVAQDLSRYTFNLVKQNISIVGVPNLSALVIGTFLPVSPIAAVFLNNGSCLVAAANALRTLTFKPKPLPEAESVAASAATYGLTPQVITEFPLDLDEDPQPSASSADPDLLSVAEEHDPDTQLSDHSVIPSSDLKLSSVELARRLGASYQTITSKRRKGELEGWSRELDPEGLAWSFSKESNLYQTA